MRIRWWGCVLAAAVLPLAPIGVLVADEDPAPPAPAPSGREERAKAAWDRVLALWKQKRVPETLAAAEEARTLVESLYGPDAPETAKAWRDLGAFLRAAGDREKARAAYERALAGVERGAAVPPLSQLRWRNDLGLLAGDLGDLTTAVAEFQRALALLARVEEPPGEETAAVLGNLAQALQALARYDEALPLLERALEIDERLHGPMSRSTAIALTNLGGLLAELSRFEQARPLFARALAIAEAVFEPGDELRARMVGNYAALLCDLGAYEEALPLLERAQQLAERLDDGGEAQITALGNLASALKYLGQHDAALPLYERALAMSEKLWGPEHVETGRCLNNLGLLHTEAGRPEQALPLLERHARIMEAGLGADHPSMATALGNVAGTLEALGRRAEALPLYRRSVDLRVRHLGEAHPATANGIVNLSNCLQWLGERAEGLREAQRALAAYEQVFGPDHAACARALTALVGAFDGVGQRERAAGACDRLLALRERALRSRLTVLAPQERLALVRDVRLDVDERLRLARGLGQDGYPLVLHWKGLASRVEHAERRARRGADPARMEALAVEQRRLASLANAVPGRADAEGRAAWQREFAERSAAVDRLERALVAAAPGGAADGAPRTVDELRARLGADEALVDVLRVGDEYMAWIVTRAAAPRRLDLGSAEALESAAAGYRRDEPVEAELVARAWAPIAAALPSGVRRVWFVPDAALASLPLSAFPGGAPGRLLIDELEIVHLVSAQDLFVGGPGRATSRGALLMGGIDYDAAADAAAAGDVAPATTPGGGEASGERAPRGIDFRPLAQTAREVEALRALLGERVEVRTGRGATEAALRVLAPGREVLHLATHGFVRTDLRSALAPPPAGERWLGATLERRLAGHDPMLLAGLALAGANPRQGGGDDDGILTAAEVAALDLTGVRLAVLSACETALGRQAAGEGVLGLVRGFQLAGVRTVVASLWAVDDAATRALMTALYGRLAAGDDAPAALRAAQQAVRSEERWSSPRYWAAWTVWGASR